MSKGTLLQLNSLTNNANDHSLAVSQGYQEAAQPKPQIFTFSNFMDLKRIGSGKFGKVFYAREKQSGTAVALKVVYKKLLD